MDIKKRKILYQIKNYKNYFNLENNLAKQKEFEENLPYPKKLLYEKNYFLLFFSQYIKFITDFTFEIGRFVCVLCQRII